MRIITTGRITQFIERFPDAEKSLRAWKQIIKTARWQGLVDVRKVYPSADAAGRYTVFDIRHNKYRLITRIEYRYQMVFIKDFMTHAEYDKERWK